MGAAWLNVSWQVIEVLSWEHLVLLMCLEVNWLFPASTKPWVSLRTTDKVPQDWEQEKTLPQVAKYELGCPTTYTKTDPCHIHTVHVQGGNKKY